MDPKLNTITSKLREYPFLVITILVGIISIIFFIYLPFQVELFPVNQVSKVYYVDNISDAHLYIIKRFNEKYKNKIEVVPVNLPFNHFTTNDRKAILTRSLRNRSDGIDIFAVDLIWVPRFAKWGYSIADKINREMLNNVNGKALESCYQNDSLVAFPMFMDIGVLYYRKDLIEKYADSGMLESKLRNSITWEEFITLGKKYKSTKNPFYIFTGGDFEGMMCCFHELLSEEVGKSIFNKKEIELNIPPVKKALQQIVDFIHTYKFSPPDVSRFDEYRSYVYANEKDAVFLRGWIGYHKQYKRYLQDTSKIKNMKIVPLPHFKGSKTASVFGGWNLMISKFSKQKDEALKFIDFMFQKENQEILYEIGGVIPVNKQVFEDRVFMDNA